MDNEHEFQTYKLITKNDITFDDWMLLSKEEKWGYHQSETSQVKAPNHQDLYKCKCGSKNISTVQKQKRSTDEAPTIYHKCNGCGNTWVQ